MFALGGAESTGVFCLRTLSFSRPTTIVGPILDMVAVSHCDTPSVTIATTVQSIVLHLLIAVNQ
jgi:hypothetical protein